MKCRLITAVLVLCPIIVCGCNSTHHANEVVSAGVTNKTLGITDVAQMAQAHVSDNLIIAQIQGSHSTFQLSPTDIIWLKQNGVSDAVVQAMQATPPPTVVAPAAYIVEPPPPPVYFGFGYGYYRHRW